MAYLLSFQYYQYYNLNSTSLLLTSDLKPLRCTHCKFFSFFSGKVLDISIRVLDYLAVIILLLCWYCSTRLEWTLLEFKIVTTLRSPFYSVFLRLSKDYQSLWNYVNLISYSNSVSVRRLASLIPILLFRSIKISISYLILLLKSIVSTSLTLNLILLLKLTKFVSITSLLSATPYWVWTQPLSLLL